MDFEGRAIGIIRATGAIYDVVSTLTVISCGRKATNMAPVAEWNEVAPTRGSPGVLKGSQAPKYYEHNSQPDIAWPGSKVSRSGFLQDRLIQFRICQHLPAAALSVHFPFPGL